MAVRKAGSGRDRVGTEGTFGRGDLKCVSPRGLDRAPGVPTGTNLRALLLRGTSVLH